MGWRKKCKKCNAFHRDADAEAKRQPPPATTSGAVRKASLISTSRKDEYTMQKTFSDYFLCMRIIVKNGEHL
jgi:hypothetical protein